MTLIDEAHAAFLETASEERLYKNYMRVKYYRDADKLKEIKVLDEKPIKEVSPIKLILGEIEPLYFENREELDRAIQWSKWDKGRPLSKIMKTIDLVDLTISSEEPIIFMVREYAHQKNRLVYFAFPYYLKFSKEYPENFRGNIGDIKIEPYNLDNFTYKNQFEQTEIQICLGYFNPIESRALNFYAEEQGYQPIRWLNEE